jgi:hypothetical protein
MLRGYVQSMENALAGKFCAKFRAQQRKAAKINDKATQGSCTSDPSIADILLELGE